MKTKIFSGFLFVLLFSPQIIAQHKSVQGAVYNKIAFTRSQTQTDWDIWIMNRDGTGEQRLADNTFRDTNPHFNPQGTKIVFARITSQQPMQSDIYVMDSDGSNQTNLTSIGTLTQPCVGPHFSWDGTKIAFDVTAAPGNGDLWIMNSDGTGHTAVLATNGDDSSPTFSPDGQWLVFQRKTANDPNPKSKICKVKISDGTVVDLTDGSDLDETPVYSTDGQYILFKRGFTVWDLYRMPHDHNPSNNADIINITNQPTMPAGTANYSWEGDKIVYYTGQLAPETSEIYVMNTDGSGKTKITNNNVADWDPSFSPAQAVSAPEINLKGNGVDIVNGDNSAGTADHTDFGSALVDGGSVTRTFTIENKGTQNLSLTGNPVIQITGTAASDFSVISNPSATIAAGGSTTFHVKFDPSGTGTKSATISIANNDADENPYTFAIQGTGAAAASAVYGKIAYCKQQSSSDWDIWIMNSDGSNQTKLLDSDAKDMNPHFSPDGKYIAFTRTSGTAPNITNDAYIMNSDGTNVTNLTADVSESCVGPKFAWDGSKIAFFRNIASTGFALCTMNLDGTNKQYINDQSGNPVLGDSPFFTPDGEWVVFQRVNPDQLTGAIYKVPVAGGSVIQLTNAADFDELPRVSPDGQYVICKYAPVAGGKSDIAKFSINQTPQTSSVTNLTNTVNEDEDSPMYSYEADKIAFMGTAGNNSMEIWVMNPDGTNKTRLTNNSEQDFDPTFSPGGAKPGQVTLLSPPNNSVNQPLTFNISWISVSSSVTYDLQVSTDQNFQVLVIVEQGLTATNKIITSLLNSIKYYWRVRAVNNFGSGPWSEPFNFTTVMSLPSKVTLVSPADNSTLNNNIVTLTWLASIPDVDNYWLEVADNINFTNPITDQNVATISKEFTAVANKSYWWKVKAHNAAGWGEFSNIWKFNSMTVDVKDESLPAKTELYQNYPNPFNSGTEISFNLAKESFVTITIYNILGKEIEVLTSKEYSPGSYILLWNPSGIPSGVYFCDFKTNTVQRMIKLLYLK